MSSSHGFKKQEDTKQSSAAESKIIQKQELLQKFKMISDSVQAYIKLSVTGLPPGAGQWMSKKSEKFEIYARAWVQGEVSFFQQYPGLSATTSSFIPNQNLGLKANLGNLKHVFINHISENKEFSFESTNTEEIVEYLNRCRILRYGDCDAHALETAMLLVQSGLVDPEHVHIMNDQKWGHTFLRISPHTKCPFSCVIDPWANKIAANVISLKRYNNKNNLSDGSPVLKHVELAEAFIRDPTHKIHVNILMLDEYRKKISNSAAYTDEKHKPKESQLHEKQRFFSLEELVKRKKRKHERDTQTGLKVHKKRQK